MLNIRYQMPTMTVGYLFILMSLSLNIVFNESGQLWVLFLSIGMLCTSIIVGAEKHNYWVQLTCFVICSFSIGCVIQYIFFKMHYIELAYILILSSIVSFVWMFYTNVSSVVTALTEQILANLITIGIVGWYFKMPVWIIAGAILIAVLFATISTTVLVLISSIIKEKTSIPNVFNHTHKVYAKISEVLFL